jgi:hypothetical protein
MSALTVYLNGNIDITEYVHSRPSLRSEIPLFGQMMVGSSATIDVVNKDGWANYNNPASPFYGFPDLSEFTVSIFYDDQKMFEGLIDSIHKNGLLATISLQSEICKLVSQRLIYASTEISNPAKIFREICTQYSIPYDPISVGHSESIYELNEVRCSAYILTPDSDIASVFQMLCTVGVARIYSNHGVLYFDVYEDIYPVGICTIDSRAFNANNYLITNMEISNVPRDTMTGYDIETVKGTASYQSDSEAMQTINAGSDAIVRINTLQSAVWIGETWIEYTGRDDTQTRFGVATKTLGRDLEIGYPVDVYDKDTGNTLTVEITSIDRSDTIVTQCQGVTR